MLPVILRKAGAALGMLAKFGMCEVIGANTGFGRRDRFFSC
jgi:hypothetical protein